MGNNDGGDGGGYELIVLCDNEVEFPNGVRCREVKCPGIGNCARS